MNKLYFATPRTARHYLAHLIRFRIDRKAEVERRVEIALAAVGLMAYKGKTHGPEGDYETLDGEAVSIVYKTVYHKDDPRPKQFVIVTLPGPGGHSVGYESLTIMYHDGHPWATKRGKRELWLNPLFEGIHEPCRELLAAVIARLGQEY